MKRILIMGCAGCGKSTLAKELGQILSLPVYHLDVYYWQPGWVETEKEEFIAKQKEILATDEWIIDGNYRSTLDLRLERADYIIFLDYRRGVALRGIIKRYFKYRNKTRDSITIGCDEKIDRDFIKWVWNFKRDAKPILVQKIKEHPEIPVVFFKKRRDLKKYLTELKK